MPRDELSDGLVSRDKLIVSESLQLSLKHYHELDAKPETELTVEEQVDKHLAGNLIGSTVVDMILEHNPPVFHNGEYRLGQHIYRRDRSGFFVMGRNQSGQETYLIFLSFADPVQYQFATREKWIDLADDLLTELGSVKAKS